MVDIPDIAKTEAAIIQHTNAFRRDQGLAGVTPDPRLMRAARQFAVYLAKTGQLAHEADGRAPSARATAAGYGSCWISENLAYRRHAKGFTAAALATSAMEGWKNSSAHRTNLMDRNMVHIGVGIARAPDEPSKYLAVQMFGHPGKKVRGCRAGSEKGSPSSRTARTTHSLAPLAAASPFPHVPGAPPLAQTDDVAARHRIDARFRARDGTLYRLVEAPDGKLRVDAGPM